MLRGFHRVKASVRKKGVQKKCATSSSVLHDLWYWAKPLKFILPKFKYWPICPAGYPWWPSSARPPRAYLNLVRRRVRHRVVTLRNTDWKGGCLETSLWLGNWKQSRKKKGARVKQTGKWEQITDSKKQKRNTWGSNCGSEIRALS